MAARSRSGAGEVPQDEAEVEDLGEVGEFDSAEGADVRGVQVAARQFDMRGSRRDLV
jgi:hypothetical protein